MAQVYSASAASSEIFAVFRSDRKECMSRTRSPLVLVFRALHTLKMWRDDTKCITWSTNQENGLDFSACVRLSHTLRLGTSTEWELSKRHSLAVKCGLKSLMACEVLDPKGRIWGQQTISALSDTRALKNLPVQDVFICPAPLLIGACRPSGVLTGCWCQQTEIREEPASLGNAHSDCTYPHGQVSSCSFPLFAVTGGAQGLLEKKITQQPEVYICLSRLK